MHPAITLDALRVLLAIHEKGSFAEAAKSLFKVPSALTYTVSKLEQDLGVALFNRQGQRAVLTQAGELLIKEGADLLRAASRLEDGVRQLESGWETRMVIAKDTVINTPALLSVVQAFCQLDKQVDIQILEEALGGGWDALHSQRADIAVGVTGELPKGQYQLHQIGEIEFVFCVCPQHPLTQYGGLLETAQIRNYPAIVVSDSSRHLPQRSSGLFESKQILRLPSMMAKLDALKQGMGVGFMPLHLVKGALERVELVGLTTALHRPPIPIYFAWRSEQAGKALKWFVEQFKQVNWLE
jgi:DNA-binding transcriptional LysR family regulator